MVGHASDGKAAIEQAQRLHPDVLVLDISMLVIGRFDAGREIKAELSEVRIVFVTAHDDAALATVPRAIVRR